MKRNLQSYFTVLICGSFAVFLFFTAFGAGIDALSWTETDSQGRVFDFNHPMSYEHFTMAMRRVTVIGMLKEAGGYGILLALMHFMGLTRVQRSEGCSSRRHLIFFAVQSPLFALGWLAAYNLPSLLGPVDREFFIDFLPVFAYGQAPWVLVSAAAAITLKFWDLPSRTYPVCSPLQQPQ